MKALKPFPVAAFAVAALLVGGCGAGEGRAADGGVASSPTAMLAEGRSKSEVASPTAKTELPRKIIYRGEVALATEDLDRAADGLERETKRFGGYIGDANRTGRRGSSREAAWTVRIPSDRFDAFLRALPALGEFQSASRTAQDVSEEYYDADARVRTKRVEEARLVEMLKRVAGNLDQILRVEKELSRVREEIETIEGRLRFLAHETDLSTVTVTIREVKTFLPAGPPTLRTEISRSFHGSIDAMSDLGRGLLVVFVAVAPWALPLGLIVGLSRKIVSRRSRVGTDRVPPRVGNIPE